VTKSRNGTILRHIHVLFNVGTVAGLTDEQLLDQFTTCTGEAAELAFAALVERHGPMVLRVCQSVLREPHDAQDAFQATFLVLVRKAGSIRKRGSLVSWLHGVACRIASCGNAATARRRRHERKTAERAATSVDDGDRDDLASVLHEELDRLPEKYRAPIVLCYLESRTHEEAAQQLRWPVGTVRSRLARGRDQLRGRLMRRGLALSVGLLEGALSAEKATAEVPAALASLTAEAAARFAAGRLVTTGVNSAAVTLLLEGAMNAMFVTKIKFALLACGLFATAAVVVAQQVGRAPERGTPPASVGAIESHAGRSEALDDAAADQAAVARELGRLDLELLAEEVQQLRSRVEVTLRDKLRAERRNSGAASEGSTIPAAEMSGAQSAYEAARAYYRAKARELNIAQRRLGGAEQRRDDGHEGSRGSTLPNDDRVRERAAGKTGPRPSAAAIGTIDMDAVMKRYEKVQQVRQRFNADIKAERERRAKRQAQFEKLVSQMQRLAPGSADFIALENEITALKGQYETEREKAQSEFARREARTTAALYEEIQETVAALAKAKGLNYVVRVSPVPQSDSEPNEVVTAVNRSIVYADPEDDVTEEVIRILNRRFKAKGD